MNKGFAARSTFKYGGKLRPGTLSPKREVPLSINRPDYASTGKPKQKDLSLPWEIPPKSPEIIEKMRIAGRIAREVLDEGVRMVKPGITTDDIDAVVHQATISRNAYPSPLNYHNFPKSCCTSINEVICHGIPDSTVLQDGDIINVDVTVYFDGVHGDCSETVFVGNVNDQIKDLVVTTYTAWKAAIDYCKPGMPFSGIGAVIEDIITPKGYTSVREFCGHG
jgi:methionyl aminopeptidase